LFAMGLGAFSAAFYARRVSDTALVLSSLPSAGAQRSVVQCSVVLERANVPALLSQT